MRCRPETSLGKLRHACRARWCARPKLEQLIDSVTEGLGGGGAEWWGGVRSGGGGAAREYECVCSPNLRQQDDPLFGVLALEGKGRVASPAVAAPGSSAEAGLRRGRLDAEVAAALPELDCCQPLRHQAELFLCYCCCVSFIRSL